MMKETEEREQLLREHEEKEKRGSSPKNPTPSSSTSSVRKRAGPNPRVFLKIEIRGKLNGKLHNSGRLELELFADSVPKTSENFRCLVTGEKGRDLSFANCMFHSIVPGLMAQGGDITAGDGSGGRSIYGDTFADESFSRRHDARGVLSMANSGPNTNSSVFQLMFDRATHLDKKHVVFGKVTRDDDDILKQVEQTGSRSGVPKNMVSIVECGEIGGDSISSTKRSRSRSQKLPSRVQYRSDGLVDYKRHKSDGRKYSSMSDIRGRR
jgi:cyclophilin family peptidyl-prolyl cis-trans isomerase